MPYMPQASRSRFRSYAAATIAAAWSGDCSRQLEREHRSEAAHLADRVVLRRELLEARAHRLAERGRLGEELRIRNRVEYGDRRCARKRVAAERASEPPGGHCVHDRSGARHRGQRQAAADRLAGDEKIGRDTLVVLDRPHLPGPPHAGLHLVVDEEDAVLAADLGQPQQVVGRHREEAALSLHRLEHDAGDRRRIDLGLEELLQAGDRVVGRDSTVRVRHRSAVDLGRERPEARLIGLDLGGHRHRQERAAVEGVVEDDDGRPTGCRARDLDGVLVGLGARVDEDRLLLLPGARRELREPTADLDVRLVDAHHEALVEVVVGLRLDRSRRPARSGGPCSGSRCRRRNRGRCGRRRR